MVAVAFLLIWGGYSAGLFGWCLFKDYDITLGQLVSPLHPYAGPWPPARIGDDVIWPGGRTPAAGAAPKAPAHPVSPGAVEPKNGKCPAGYTMIAGQCVPFAA